MMNVQMVNLHFGARRQLILRTNSPKAAVDFQKGAQSLGVPCIRQKIYFPPDKIVSVAVFDTRSGTTDDEVVLRFKTQWHADEGKLKSGDTP